MNKLKKLSEFLKILEDRDTFHTLTAESIPLEELQLIVKYGQALDNIDMKLTPSTLFNCGMLLGYLYKAESDRLDRIKWLDGSV